MKHEPEKHDEEKPARWQGTEHDRNSVIMWTGVDPAAPPKESWPSPLYDLGIIPFERLIAPEGQPDDTDDKGSLDYSEAVESNREDGPDDIDEDALDGLLGGFQ